MTKEPWKRAAQLSRERYRTAGQEGDRRLPPELARPRPRIACVVLWFILLLVIGVLATMYLTRGRWVPRYREKMPEPVAQVVEQMAPEPPQSVDWHLVERGLGAELMPFSDYLQFVGRLGDWHIAPRLVDTGSGTWRVSAPGVLVHVQRGLIWNYDLDLNELFSADGLQPWCDELRRARLTPELTWTALTGAEQMPHGSTDYTYESKRSVHLDDGWYYPVFVLHFVDGWLRHVELEVRFGASETTGPSVK